MKFTKRLLTIALSMGMVMPLCATAYAAKTVDILSATIKQSDQGKDLYDVTVTFSAESSNQVTLLLTGPNTDKKLDDNDIVHINQFGKNNPDEANIIGSGTCTFSVTKARMETAGATVNESAGTTTMSVIMGADDATEAADPEPVTYVTSGTETVSVEKVTLGDDSIDLTVGDTQTLGAVVHPANATNRNVEWESSDTAVATVDATGRVTAVAPGEATITVTTVDGGHTAECTVRVTAATVAVTGVTLNKTTLGLVVGGEDTLVATVTPDNATNRNVTWESSAESVATVDATGKVTAVAEGTATITATAGGVSATCAVTVSAAPVEATDIALDPTAITLTESETAQLTATLTPSNATSEVLWESSNTAVATVDDNGLVTAVAVGEPATITAFIDANGDGALDDGDTIRATCVVTVTAAPEFKPGDIFTDGLINTKDAVKLAQYLAGWEITLTENEKKAADVFKDGLINTKDAVKLAQYLAGWEITLD